MPPYIFDVDTIVGFWPIRNVDISPAQLRAVMARHGVSRACVCSARGVWYDYEEGNDETIRWAQQERQLTPVMTLDPRRWLGCREEIRRRVREGHRIFRLFPEYQGWSLALASARRLLGYLEDEGAIVIVGGTADVAVPAVRGLRMPVLLAGCHFYQLAEVLAETEGLEHLYLSTRFLVAPGSLDIAAARLGADHLVFGSHAPLAYLAPAVRTVAASALDDASRAAVFAGNLKRLLGDDHEDH